MASEETAPRTAEAARPERRRGLAASGLTVRAVVLGILSAGGGAVLYPFLSQGNNIHGMGMGHFPWGPVLMLFFFVFVVNVAFKLANRAWALRPQEIVVIFIMALVAVVSGGSLLLFLIATLASPRYYASPENEWADLFLDDILSWMAPEDTGKAITWFYEGLPLGEIIPWAAWLPSLLWWCTFVMAVYLICIALVALFRKQWVENERLLFPLMSTPMALMEDSASPKLLPAITKKPAFLVGFLLIFGMLAWNVVTFLKPGLPLIHFGGAVNFGRTFPRIFIAATPWIIGLCYFVNPEVLFSFWFFQLLIRFEQALFTRIGFSIGTSELGGFGPAGVPRYVSVIWQSYGAFSLFILYGVWAGRHHLADVFRRAWRGLRTQSDERELMSPRLAVACLVLGVVYVAAFMARTGMSAPVIVLFLPAVILAYFGTTRLVIESGLPYVKPPLMAQLFTMHTLGSAGMSNPSMVGIAFSFGWITNLWSAFMPAAAHGAKLADLLRMNGRVIVIATILGIAVALPVALWYYLYSAYHTGAHNFSTWVYQGGFAFDYITANIRGPRGPDLPRLSFMGLGATLTGLLIFARHRFSWWPLHPIGLTCPLVPGMVGHLGSFFLTWLAKVILIKIGGQSLYERGKPFFIGLVVGHIAGALLYVIANLVLYPGEGYLSPPRYY